jgi:signal transduction histidine kinase
MLLQEWPARSNRPCEAAARTDRIERPTPADDHQRDLDISRIEAARCRCSSRPSRFPISCEVKSSSNRSSCGQKLPVTLQLARSRADFERSSEVKRIILNLLSNALKFTHHGSVTISARRNVRERTVTLSVADTGIGIAGVDQDRIFDDFRQLDNSPTRAYGGTGLGLSICRRLAQMLGGRISVQSQVGKGSTFIVTLPTKGRK